GAPPSRRSAASRPAAAPAPRAAASASPCSAAPLVPALAAVRPGHRGPRPAQVREEQVEQARGPDALLAVEAEFADFALFQLGVVVRVRADGAVEGAVGLGVGPGAGLAAAGPGLLQADADLGLGAALDVLGLGAALALLQGHLAVALADDAVEDGLAHLAGVVEPAQADVHDLDAVLGRAVAVRRQQPRPQGLALPVHPAVAVADQVLQVHAGDGGAEAAADAVSQQLAGALGGADGDDEALGGLGVGHAPDDVGVDGQRLVHAAAAGVLGDQLGGRQVEHLEPPIDAHHGLHRPGPAPGAARPPVRGA